MAKKARGTEIAPKVRLAFEQALENMRDTSGGVLTLANIIQDCLATDPLRTLDTMSKYIPKEMLIDQTVEVNVIGGDPISVEEWEKKFVEHEPVKSSSH